MINPWKLVVRSFKAEPDARGRPLVREAILDAAGMPLKLREARRRLFILTKRASEGLPTLVETDAGLVCLISVDDLVDVVMDPPPTLHEVVWGTRTKDLR